jgi:hypothetical protein
VKALPASCVPLLRDCVERELASALAERGQAAAWPFRAILESIGWLGQRDVSLDTAAHGRALGVALRGSVAEHLARPWLDRRDYARLLALETMLRVLGLDSGPVVMPRPAALSTFGVRRRR